MEESDDRTTPTGLFNYAHTYWTSAVALQKTSLACTHKDAPVDYLYFHSIELYLKSYLRLKGLGVNDLRIKFRHGMLRAYRAALKAGLSKDDETRAVLKLIDRNYLRARYIETGAFTKASPEALWGVCRVLHDEIEPQVNAAIGASRTRAIPYIDDAQEIESSFAL